MTRLFVYCIRVQNEGAARRLLHAASELEPVMRKAREVRRRKNGMSTEKDYAPAEQNEGPPGRPGGIGMRNSDES